MNTINDTQPIIASQQVTRRGFLKAFTASTGLLAAGWGASFGLNKLGEHVFSDEEVLKRREESIKERGKVLEEKIKPANSKKSPDTQQIVAGTVFAGAMVGAGVTIAVIMDRIAHRNDPPRSW